MQKIMQCSELLNEAPSMCMQSNLRAVRDVELDKEWS